MDILPANFKVLQFCGVWDEGEYDADTILTRLLRFLYSDTVVTPNVKSSKSSSLRTFSRYAVVLVIYHFTVCEIIELAYTRDNIEELTEGIFLTFSFIALCLKIGNFIVRKKEVVGLLMIFRHELCCSRNIAEKEILDKYANRAKWCSYMFMTMAQLTGLALLIAPVFSWNSGERPLPLKMYTPYSTSDPLAYAATYIEQIIVMCYGVWINISLDCLVYSFTICTCGQIELLYYRLSVIFEGVASEDVNNAGKEQRLIIQQCIRHHLMIYDSVQRIQSLFVWIVTLLLLFSMITVCTSIFRMSKQSMMSAEFFSLSLYLNTILVQTFFYCWYGNELELKSRGVGQAAYFTNWTNASLKERKSLLILMTSNQKGLNLSYGGIIALSLNTFTWILKTSYSAFNVLQQMSN